MKNKNSKYLKKLGEMKHVHNHEFFSLIKKYKIENNQCTFSEIPLKIEKRFDRFNYQKISEEILDLLIEGVENLYDSYAKEVCVSARDLVPKKDSELDRLIECIKSFSREYGDHYIIPKRKYKKITENVWVNSNLLIRETGRWFNKKVQITLPASLDHLTIGLGVFAKKEEDLLSCLRENEDKRRKIFYACEKMNNLKIANSDLVKTNKQYKNDLANFYSLDFHLEPYYLFSEKTKWSMSTTFSLNFDETSSQEEVLLEGSSPKIKKDLNPDLISNKKIHRIQSQ